MYAITVILLLVVLPLVSVGLDHFFFDTAARPILLVGKWFVFWSAGVRLALAGLRQYFQPKFTAQRIFGISGDDALPFVRELGVANFAMGTAGIVSLFVPGFILPVALIGAIFYLVAGFRHAGDKGKNRDQTLAMFSDIFVGLIFTAYVAFFAFA